MKRQYCLHYSLKIRELESEMNKPSFQSLALNQQKDRLSATLDHNQLYIPAAESKDSKFQISNKDIHLTKKFYEAKY